MRIKTDRSCALRGRIDEYGRLQCPFTPAEELAEKGVRLVSAGDGWTPAVWEVPDTFTEKDAIAIGIASYGCFQFKGYWR